MNAVDTNILLYSIDRNEPVKQAKAHQLLKSLPSAPAPTILLWQVLGETVQQLRFWRDKGRLTQQEYHRHVQDFRSFLPVVFPTLDLIDHALDLADRYSLAHWDSMILGACKAAGITTLFSEDMGAARSIDSIQLVNPVI